MLQPFCQDESTPVSRDGNKRGIHNYFSATANRMTHAAARIATSFASILPQVIYTLDARCSQQMTGRFT